MTVEPTRVEVLQWLELTGRAQSDAVAHFWPDAGDQERRRVEARVRKWVQRDRERGRSRVVAPLAGPAPAAPTPQPRAVNRETAPAELDPDADPVDFLSAYLRNLLSDLEKARLAGRYRDARQLDRPILEVRARLQAERERERGVVRLPRTPAAISAELQRRAPAIALRAEMRRRVTEHDNSESMSLKASESRDGS